MTNIADASVHDRDDRPRGVAGSVPIVEIGNLTKRREQGGTAFELHVPALRMHPGQFVAVLGDSGCGKSTLLDMLALVLRPSACERFVFRVGTEKPDAGPETAGPAQPDPAAEIIDAMALWGEAAETAMASFRRRHVGYVLQTGGLYPFLSVFENIMLPLRLNRRGQEAARVRDLAARLGLGEHLDKKPRYLSGGQRQRTAVLRAIVHEPALIIADEPTAAVDKARARDIVRALGDLAREQGATVAMVTHDHDLVAPVADVTYSFRLEEADERTTRSHCYQRA